MLFPARATGCRGMNHCQNRCAKDGHIRDWISSSNELNTSQKKSKRIHYWTGNDNILPFLSSYQPRKKLMKSKKREKRREKKEERRRNCIPSTNKFFF
jgi:hypothetical protein